MAGGLSRGLATKTANRYLEIIVRLLNLAIQKRGLAGLAISTSAVKLERYPESAPEIRYMSITQIDEQPVALIVQPQLKAMVVQAKTINAEPMSRRRIELP